MYHFQTQIVDVKLSVLYQQDVKVTAYILVIKVPNSNRGYLYHILQRLVMHKNDKYLHFGTEKNVSKVLIIVCCMKKQKKQSITFIKRL